MFILLFCNISATWLLILFSCSWPYIFTVLVWKYFFLVCIWNLICCYVYNEKIMYIQCTYILQWHRLYPLPVTFLWFSTFPIHMRLCHKSCDYNTCFVCISIIQIYFEQNIFVKISIACLLSCLFVKIIPKEIFIALHKYFYIAYCQSTKC